MYTSIPNALTLERLVGRGSRVLNNAHVLYRKCLFIVRNKYSARTCTNMYMYIQECMNGSFTLFLPQFYHALLLPLPIHVHTCHISLSIFDYQSLTYEVGPTSYSCSRPDKFSFSNQIDERHPPILRQAGSRGLHLTSNPKSCFSGNGESRKPCTCTTYARHTHKMDEVSQS